MLFGHDGGAEPNVGYLFYLYDPATGQFVFDEFLSGLTQTKINPRTKTISAAWRNGCSHSNEEYWFIGGQLTLTASHWETVSASSPDRVAVTKGKSVNGKRHEKVQRFGINDLYSENKKKPAVRRKPAKRRTGPH